MRYLLCKLPVWLIPLLWMLSLQADENAPWGRASLKAIDYAPHKVVYDVAAPDVESFSSVLDRVSYLNNLYHADPFDASIVLVLQAMKSRFSIDNFHTYRDLMLRARSLKCNVESDVPSRGTLNSRVLRWCRRFRASFPPPVPRGPPPSPLPFLPHLTPVTEATPIAFIWRWRRNRLTRSLSRAGCQGP